MIYQLYSYVCYLNRFSSFNFMTKPHSIANRLFLSHIHAFVGYSCQGKKRTTWVAQKKSEHGLYPIHLAQINEEDFGQREVNHRNLWKVGLYFDSQRWIRDNLLKPRTLSATYTNRIQQPLLEDLCFKATKDKNSIHITCLHVFLQLISLFKTIVYFFL